MTSARGSAAQKRSQHRSSANSGLNADLLKEEGNGVLSVSPVKESVKESVNENVQDFNEGENPKPSSKS